MKKVLCAMIALVMCLAMAAPAFAAEDDFVPSVSYKDAPEVENAEMDGEDLTPCVIVTSILGAKNKTTDIFQEARDQLLSVYEQLLNGTMTLPLEGDYVIRDLVDVSLAKTDCVEAGDDHEEKLNQADISISVTFDVDVGAMVDVLVFQYKGGEWKSVEAKNNGDGTVTCVFHDFCPVAFAVDASESDTPQTGDAVGQNMGLWVGLMAVSAVVLVVTVTNRRKIFG